MMRHAIMIMAHADYDQLRTLVEVLDNPAIDIFIHINKRSYDWDPKILSGATTFSKVYFVPRVKIFYCDYSQVNAQVSLLNSATKRGYDYYHILSGADLPLHPIAEFLHFFEKNKGYEFIGLAPNYDKRMAGIKAFFSNSIRISKGVLRTLLLKSAHFLKTLQLRFKVNLSKGYKGEPFQGCDWWSISHSAAMYVLENEPIFKKYFIHCYCPSELFVQTILCNSPFAQKLYNPHDECLGSLREIDWTRGEPYVWRKDDYKQLIASPCMFARKFSSHVDNQIIEQIKNHIIQ